MFCHSFIGNQHEILYDFCRHIALIRLNLDRMSLFVQHDLALREIKINRASLFALFPQDSRKLTHQLKHRHKRFIFMYLCLVFVLQNFLDTRVGHSSVYVDNGLHNLVAYDLAFFINRHQAAHRQTVLPCI